MSIPVSPKHFLSLKSFLSECFFTTFARLFRRSFLLLFPLHSSFCFWVFYHSDSVGCRPSIVSLDLLTFQNNSVNVVFSGWQDFIEIWPFFEQSSNPHASFTGNQAFISFQQVKCIVIERKLIQLPFEYEADTICFVNAKISPWLTDSKESQLAYGVSMFSSVYSFKADPQQG